MATKNPYAQKAKKQEILKMLKGEASAKGQAGGSFLVSFRDLGIVVLGGGLAAAVAGKLSLPAGFIITGLGHYTDNKIVQLLGVGTMAAHGFNKAGAVNGLEGLDGVKERLQAFKESLKDKFFLDKILKKKEATTSGFGNVQYFNYPDTVGDLSALDDIEEQLAESAIQYQQQMGAGNIYNDMTGVGELADLEERLY